MVHRKLAADNIFTGYEMLGSDSVLVLDENGTVLDIINSIDAGEDIERSEGILAPGFINCHCHLELSHMKGIISEGTGMVEFLLSVMNKRNITEAHINESIAAAEKEMLLNGIVAVGDICNTDHTISHKLSSQIYYHNFIEATGFVPATAASRFNAAVELYNKFISIGAASIVPHAPYSVSPELFKLINEFDGNSLLTMHNQESVAENEFFLTASGDMLKLYSSIGVDIKHFSGTGRSSLINSLGYISANHKMILVHNVLTDKDDLAHVSHRMNNLCWCLCPNANKYINDALPDIDLLRNYTDKIVLGTDSLASNHELNILAEIKTIRASFPHIKLEETLRWATINGAEALGIANKYGSFEKGKQPGIIKINAEGAAPVSLSRGNA